MPESYWSAVIDFLTGPEMSALDAERYNRRRELVGESFRKQKRGTGDSGFHGMLRDPGDPVDTWFPGEAVRAGDRDTRLSLTGKALALLERMAGRQR